VNACQHGRKDGLGCLLCVLMVPMTRVDIVSGCHVHPRSNLAWCKSAARKAGALLPCFGLGGDWGPIGTSSSTASARVGSRLVVPPPLASSSITIDPSSGSRFGVSFFEPYATSSYALKVGPLYFPVARFHGGISGSLGAAGINAWLPMWRHGRKPL
jgi:hypothetical protein